MRNILVCILLQTPIVHFVLDKSITAVYMAWIYFNQLCFNEICEGMCTFSPFWSSRNITCSGGVVIMYVVNYTECNLTLDSKESYTTSELLSIGSSMYAYRLQVCQFENSDNSDIEQAAFGHLRYLPLDKI